MTISFFCFRCGRNVVVEAQSAGNTTTCPNCRENLTVPNATPFGGPMPSLKPRAWTPALLLSVVVLCAGAWLYFTPHITVHRLQRAIDNRDATAISEFIDFPSVRESFKANLKASFVQHMTDTNRSGFEMLGMAIGAAIADPFIDAMMTPEALAMLMRGEMPAGGKTNRNELPKVSRQMRYVSFNSFVVTAESEKPKSDPMDLVFSRHGLISWRLSAIRATFPGRRAEKAVMKESGKN